MLATGIAKNGLILIFATTVALAATMAGISRAKVIGGGCNKSAHHYHFLFSLGLGIALAPLNFARKAKRMSGMGDERIGCH